MPGSIRKDRNVTTEVRDYTELQADIYRPNDKQKRPALECYKGDII
jgi:predicted acyl esterase